MHDDRVAARKVEPGSVLEHNPLVDLLLGFRELDPFALERVMQLFGAIEKGRRALDLSPAGFDIERVHH
jgi:hypothetical protein